MDNIIEKKRFSISRLIKNKGVQVFLIAVILFCVGEITVRGFTEFEHIMTILSLSSFLGIIALGQTIVIIATICLFFTKYGKIVYGVGENNVVAVLSGINSRRYW